MAISRTAASDAQRRRASERARSRHGNADEAPGKRPRAVYLAAARSRDDVEMHIGLLRETARLLRRAEEAEAWTAITRLHLAAVEQAKVLRAALAVAGDEAPDEARAASIRDLVGRLPPDLRVLAGV